MLRPVCAIFDGAVQAFTQPFFVNHTAAAVRDFGDSVNNPESPLHIHKPDFQLMHIADFDDNSGLFIPIQPPYCLIRAVDVPESEVNK